MNLISQNMCLGSTTKKQGADKMDHTKHSFLRSNAIAIAQQLLLSDKKLLPIKAWGNGETLFVSQDNKVVSAIDFFTIEETEFFIGTKK